MAIYLPLLGILAFAAAGGSRKNRVLSAALYSVLPTLAVGLYLGWNHLRFGSFLETGYPQLSEGARTVSGFGERFWRGFYGLTWSPGEGLFIFAPSALLGLILAGPYLARTGLRGLTILLLPVLAVFFYSKYNYWEGGYSWGPRYLVPAAACWVLPLAFRECDSPAERWATRGAAAFGAALQALGVSVSFLECQVGRGYYSPGFIYDLRYSSLEAHLAVFAHYLGEAFRGNLLREQEGLGFDRWFFFLRKSGFSGPLLALAVSLLCLALAGSLWWLRRASIAAAGAEAVAPPPALQTDQDASGSRAEIESKEAAQCL